MKKIAFISLVIALAIIISGCQARNTVLAPEEAEATALDFINKNLVAPGSEVAITEITDQGSVYKLKVALSDGNEIDSYMSKDGKTFFPQGLDIEEMAGKNDETGDNQPTQDLPKSDKPSVELFVMSHCPYGTQIEKGMLPVVDLLGDKIDFELKFCDYAMHGQTELDEQLNQYCIQKDQNDKFQAYLKCFLEASDGSGCLSKTSINTSQLNECVSQTDKEYGVTAKFEAKEGWKGNYPPFDVYGEDNTKYGVQGSPTLVINGTQSSAGRDAQSLLNAVCSAFNTMPDECSQQLDSTTPAPGFGFEGSGSASAAAGCGG
ncbi:hypothetical protein ACFL2U_03480 [Patescibacteria group bacterium]